MSTEHTYGGSRQAEMIFKQASPSLCRQCDAPGAAQDSIRPRQFWTRNLSTLSSQTLHPWRGTNLPLILVITRPSGSGPLSSLRVSKESSSGKGALQRVTIDAFSRAWNLVDSSAICLQSCYISGPQVLPWLTSEECLRIDIFT